MKLRNSWTFFVEGLPATKGSTKAVLSASTGKPVTLPDCKRLKGWERTVAITAQANGVRKLAGPVRVEAAFYLPSPKDLEPGTPHTKKPDVDKLLRAVLDALSRGLGYEDDAQVIAAHARKFYSTAAVGARITVESA